MPTLARQRGLEAAVGWSYDLLSAAECQVFRPLGVFTGRVALDHRLQEALVRWEALGDH